MNWEIDRHRIAGIGEDSSAIAGIVERFGTGSAVPHCGAWRVGDVVRHLGTIHRWAAEVVRTGNPAERITAAVGDDELPDWLRAGAEELSAALTATPASAPCWTFGRPPGVAGFWVRRQALETVVHRFDVESAVGLRTEIPAQVAVDGIGEVVDFLFPRQVELGRASPLPGRVALTATDTSTNWYIGAGESGTAQVSGPSDALLLMLWKRPHPPVRRSGDASVLDALDRTALTP